jgi:hypothetical protein
MQNKKSGNGVKVAKVVEEVNVIINSSLAYPEKCKKLNSIDMDRRPGKQEAEKIVFEFCKKLIKYRANNLDNRMKVEASKFQNPKSYGKFDSVEGYKAYVWFRRFNNCAGHFIVSEISKKLGLSGGRYIDYMKHRQAIHFEIKRLQNEEQRKTQERNDFTKKSGGLGFAYMGNEKNILEVQENKAGYRAKNIFCRIGDYYITVDQQETEDWEAYSKSWHNAHGPKRTIDERFIRFGKEGEKPAFITVDSFAGNYLVKAIVQFFSLKRIKVAKELKKVQLINEAEIIFIRKIQSVRIYKRTIAGTFLDYCAIYKNETYHAASIQDAVKGLIRKAKAHISEEFELINKKVGYQLGFCESGIKSFCDDNSLDFDGEYTRKELRNVVVKNRQVNCEKYKSELSKLKIFINC